MRKFVFSLMFLALSVAGLAQMEAEFIEVEGVANYKREVSKYIAFIKVSATGYDSGDASEDGKTLLKRKKEDLFSKMKEYGIDEKNFRSKNDADNPEDILTMIEVVAPPPPPSPQPNSASSNATLYKSGIFEEYIFETNSKDEFERFLKADKIAGISINTKAIYYKPLVEEDLEKIVRMAYQDARKSAGHIAETRKKKLGEILGVDDRKGITRITNWDLYYHPHYKHEYKIWVYYALAD